MDLSRQNSIIALVRWKVSRNASFVKKSNKKSACT